MRDCAKSVFTVTERVCVCVCVRGNHSSIHFFFSLSKKCVCDTAAGLNFPARVCVCVCVCVCERTFLSPGVTSMFFIHTPQLHTVLYWIKTVGFQTHHNNPSTPARHSTCWPKQDHPHSVVPCRGFETYCLVRGGMFESFCPALHCSAEWRKRWRWRP